MALLIASANLQINSFIGEPLYVVDDYVVSEYVLGGELVGQDLDLATSLSIATANVTVSAVRTRAFTSTLPITTSATLSAVGTFTGVVTTPISSTLAATALDLDLATALIVAGATISVDYIRIRPFTATLPITTTINMGTNVFDIEASSFNTFIVSQETRLNTIQRETRVNKVKQETRVFELA